MQKGCNMGGRLLNLDVLYTGWGRFLYSVHNPKGSLNGTLCLESSERIITESKEYAMGKIYSGRHTSYSDQVAVFEDGKIYSGRHASYSDQVGVIEGGKVYRGRHASYSDQVGVIENGKVYRGRHTSYSDQVGVIEGSKIYSGRHTSYSDQIGVVEGGYATASAAAAYLLLL